MIAFFKKLWEKFKIDVEQEKFNTAYFLVNRHYLSSVTLKDLDEQEDFFRSMQESEKKAYVANASLIYSNPVFLQEVRRIFGAQALFVAAQSQNWDQSLVGRGTINGVGLVEDQFRKLHSIHLENVKSNSNGSIEESREGKIF